jgi:hypothetical protein
MIKTLNRRNDTLRNMFRKGVNSLIEFFNGGGMRCEFEIVQNSEHCAGGISYTEDFNVFVL